MYDYTKLRSEVEDYLGESVGDYDVDAIMADLRDYKWDGISTIYDVSFNDYIVITESHKKERIIASIEYSGVIAPYEFVTINQSHEK